MAPNWFDGILKMFVKEHVTTQLPFQTVFDGLFIPQFSLVFHFISIHPEKISAISSTYFAEKSSEADRLSIQCIHIWEDVFYQSPLLVIARLEAMIGMRKRIHARATEIARMDKSQMDFFLNQHHLQHSVNAYYKYGLLFKNECVAMATFSKGRIMNDGSAPYRSYELIRYASLTGVIVTGGLGKLITHFINEKQPAHLMTYVDRDWGSGAGYVKLGFKFKEKTSPFPFYVDLNTKRRINIPSFNQAELDSNLFIKCYNSGSLKFVWERSIK